MPVFHFLQKLLQKPFSWLIAVSGFTLLFYFTAHEGFYYGDDYSYSLYAHQLLDGTFHFDAYVFCHRFMVFVPTALFYWLWGMNAYTTTLWPLLCTLSTLFLTYISLRKDHPIAASWAVVLIGFYYFQLNTINYLYPDNVIMLFVTVCLLILYKNRVPLKSTKKEIIWGTAFALSNFMAFLAKETVVYAAPFYLILLIYHISRRENLMFWATALLTGTLLLSAYFLTYEITTGNAFLRFHDIETAGLAVTGEEYLDKRNKFLLSRLTYSPLLFFIGSGIAIPIIFSFWIWLSPKKTNNLTLNQPFFFWAAASLSMLLCIWFGSVSTYYYKPMYLQARMFHPLFPAFCITAGLAVEATWNNRKGFLFTSILLLLCSLLAGGKMWVIYAPLAFSFLVFYFIKKIPHYVGLAAVTLALSTRPFHFMLKPTVSFYFEQKEIINKHLQNTSGEYLVLTDPTMLKWYDFFYGFEVPNNYTYKNYSTYSTAPLPKADSIFLLINNGLLEHPDHNIQLREKDILPNFPSAKLIDKEGKVKLFYLPQNPKE